MSHARMSASSVAHKSTGGTLQSLPEPVDPVGDAPDYLTFKTVAPLRQRVLLRLRFSERCSKYAPVRPPSHSWWQRRSNGNAGRLVDIMIGDD